MMIMIQTETGINAGQTVGDNHQSPSSQIQSFTNFYASATVRFTIDVESLLPTTTGPLAKRAAAMIHLAVLPCVAVAI